MKEFVPDVVVHILGDESIQEHHRRQGDDSRLAGFGPERGVAQTGQCEHEEDDA